MATKRKKQRDSAVVEYGVEAAPAQIELPKPLVVATSELLPRYPTRAENPNKMDEEKFSLLCSAIREEGFLQPIVVSPIPDGQAGEGKHYLIEDGHHRWWAAREVGLTRISVVVKKLESLSAEQSDARLRLIGIGMNRIHGEVDLTAATGVIAEAQAILDLQPMELSMLTGFSTAELEVLLAAPSDVVDLLDGAAQSVEVEEVEKGAEFVLEIKFSDRDKYRLARRKLRRMGKGDLAMGVLAALGELEDA